MHPRRYQSREFRQELERFEHDMRRPVAPEMPELIQEPAIRQNRQSFRGCRGTCDIAAEIFRLAAADPASPLFRQDIGEVSCDLGEVLTRTGNAMEAIKHLQRSISILQFIPGAADPTTAPGAAALADQYWLGKAHVLVAMSPTASANEKLEHCREALHWFQKCLPTLEGLRSGDLGHSAAMQIQEIQRDRKRCAAQ